MIFMGHALNDLPGRRYETPPSSFTTYSCRLAGLLPEQQISCSHRYHHAIASYLTSRYYNDADMRARRLRKVTDKEVSGVPLVFWSTLTCHEDHGGHMYRGLAAGLAARSRDKSWAKVR